MSRELVRSFSLLQATALNMTNMVGIGPFITIPLVIAAMGGPQCMLGWLAGAVVALCDGLVWAELAAAMPAAGGTYFYLLEAFRGTRAGVLLPFLFNRRWLSRRVFSLAGIGKLLLRRLVIYARARGIHFLRGNLQLGNDRMLELVRRSGLPYKTRYADGIWEVTIDLAPVSDEEWNLAQVPPQQI